MSEPLALTAAAEILTGQRIDDPQRQKRSWQEEAWAFYDESGPLRYGTTWVANMISKARLQAARLPPGGDEPEPIEDGPAAEAVEALAGGIGGQTQMLRSMAVQLTVPGLGYLVGTNEGDTWQVMSADVLRLAQPGSPISDPIYEVQRTQGSWTELERGSLVVKVWRPHERFFWEPDSPARAALGSLRELRRIGQYIDAVLVSRLAGAGLFIFPQEARFPTAPGEVQGQHPFVTEVMQVMMTAVRQPGTAAQVVPIPVEVPGEHADKFKLISWATELSDKILAMRESALRQASIALDIPAEILTGMGDVNHWGQWQIEESAVKVHAEPLLEVITSALTEGYLVPVLEAGGEDTTDLIIWADTSELTARPDRSDDAIQLYGLGEINGDALRRETGMADSDTPDETQLGDWAFRQMVKSANPQVIAMGLTGLGIPVPEVPDFLAPQPEAPPVEDETEDDGSGASRQTLPDEESDPEEPGDDVPFGVDLPRLLVLEGHVRRALAVAQSRLAGGSKTPLLQFAWEDAKTTLGDIGFDPVLTIGALEKYCATLLELGGTYDRTSLARAVRGLCPTCEGLAA